MSGETLTPMMSQYRQIRNKLPADTILFFRLGDFYEMFFEDAKEAAQILDITLTRRQDIPMCGIPFHAVDGYLAKLIRAGKKVAICEQVEDPALTKGIVRREVTGIVTPGTVMQDAILTSVQNNYLGGFCRSGELFGLALLDISTGAFLVEESADAGLLADTLKQFGPRECVFPAEQMNEPVMKTLIASLDRMVITSSEDWVFRYDVARDRLIRHFAVHSLEGFGCEQKTAAVGAAGGVMYYVQDELKRDLKHVRSLRVSTPSEFMMIDQATCMNLDLVPRRNEERRGSVTLLGTLDVTKTPMGARLMREWILRPLADVKGIEHRLDAVDALMRDRTLLHHIRERFTGIRDLERLVARLSAGSGNGRDLKGMGSSLSALPELRSLVVDHPVALLKQLGGDMKLLPDLAALIERAIEDEPPVALKEGGMIRKGFSPELDELRVAASEGRQWLAEFQTREQARTGIKTLKVRYNKVFGYYIEISKGQLAHAPEDYIRKQTLVNGERFVTPELKEYERKITGAQERAEALEYELFVEIRDKVVEQTAAIQQTATALAQTDVLTALAERAVMGRYVRPRISAGDQVSIKDGRHPVIEGMSEAERFVPNDTLLNGTDSQLIVLTGPNMAGKSTYIRQVALIVIMAQMGSFVPASAAEIGVVDQVFTRVGASDDIARGRSTFMVEMQETANILNNATSRSLIILDEIGRGTSTFDGISIAWAVAEYLHNNPKAKAKTLFATHYHELTDLALTMSGVKNYNVVVRERNDQIVFLRKILPGAADKSYGIQVARLAGLPGEVIDRAKEILANLEEGEFSEAGQPKLARQKRKPRDTAQLSLFG
ncbi:MAG: DNA mismatch repair protein MutS [bacterium]